MNTLVFILVVIYLAVTMIGLVKIFERLKLLSRPIIANIYIDKDGNVTKTEIKEAKP